MSSGPLGLTENPFVEGHDARFVYPSRAHREVVARLRCGIENREPFALLTGVPGVGKTMAVQAAIVDAEPRTLVLVTAAPTLSRAKFREQIIAGFAPEGPVTGSPARKADGIEARLRAVRARGRLAFLVVDEAQNLGHPLLEDLRLLSNLEADGHPLVQIILAGQPKLEEGLSRPGCDALRQRIAVRCRLGTLSAEETEGYIRHRVSVAGGDPQSLFTSECCQAIHRLAHGIPREINLLAGEAMMLASTAGESAITAGHVAGAAVLLGFRSVVADARPAVDRKEPAAAEAASVVPAADVARQPVERDEADAGLSIMRDVSLPPSCETLLAADVGEPALDEVVSSAPAPLEVGPVSRAGESAVSENEAFPPETSSTPPPSSRPARPESAEVDAWLARFRDPAGPPRIGSRLAVEAMAAASLEPRAGDVAGEEPGLPAPSRHAGARRALPRRRAPRGDRSWSSATRIAGALILVAVGGVVLSTSGRSLMVARPPARTAAGTTAVKVERARTLNASAARPSVVPVAPAPAARTSPAPVALPAPVPVSPAAVTKVPPAPVAPAAIRPAAETAPTAPQPPPARRYGVEVASFIVESRAAEERDRLAARITLPCRVATTLEDGAEVYSVVVGPVASREEAARLSEDLSGRRLVGEARVVRWAASDSTRR